MRRRLTRENGGATEDWMSVWLARGNLGLGAGTPFKRGTRSARKRESSSHEGGSSPMNRIFMRAFMASGVVLVSGAMMMAQERPMQTSPQQTSPTTNNPNTNPGMNNPASVQQAQMDQEQNAAMKKMQDKAFVKKAAEGGLAEVRLGELAQQ